MVLPEWLEDRRTRDEHPQSVYPGSNLPQWEVDTVEEANGNGSNGGQSSWTAQTQRDTTRREGFSTDPLDVNVPFPWAILAGAAALAFLVTR